MQNIKSTLIKPSILLSGLSVSSLAMAHPGHLTSTNMIGAIQAGLIHPFTGADHLMMAIGMGMLLYRTRRSVLGMGSLVLGLMSGFGIAVFSGWHDTRILENVAEYGILLSVLVTATSLFSKKLLTNAKITLASFTLLAVFHGMAHGLEIPSEFQVNGFFLGMIMSMSLLYIFGMGLMWVIKHYFGGNRRIQQLLAILGVTAVVFS